LFVDAGLEVGGVEVDADPGRVDLLDDADDVLGLVGDAAVVFESEDHALFAGVFRSGSEHFRDPVGRIGFLRAFGHSAAKDTDMPCAELGGDVDPVFEFLGGFGAGIAGRLGKNGADGDGIDFDTRFEGGAFQREQGSCPGCWGTSRR
jgi:hypothetical protein